MHPCHIPLLTFICPTLSSPLNISVESPMYNSVATCIKKGSHDHTSMTYQRPQQLCSATLFTESPSRRPSQSQSPSQTEVYLSYSSLPISSSGEAVNPDWNWLFTSTCLIFTTNLSLTRLINILYPTLVSSGSGASPSIAFAMALRLFILFLLFTNYSILLFTCGAFTKYTLI